MCLSISSCSKVSLFLLVLIFCGFLPPKINHCSLKIAMSEDKLRLGLQPPSWNQGETLRRCEEGSQKDEGGGMVGRGKNNKHFP